MSESPFFDERPIYSPEESAELTGIAREILEYVARQDRRRGAVVIGVMGGRGSGKTSVLEILGRLALHDGKGRFAVPTRGGDGSNGPVLFEPERLHPEDDLLFQLLDYLRAMPVGDLTRQGPLAEIERLATRRADPGRFLKMAEETATSTSRLPDALVQEHTKIAAHTRLVREQMRTYFQQVLDAPGLRAASDRWALLLVDDLDLQPQRALELIELTYRVMDHPGVVIVIAGHEPLLVSSIQRQLEHERRDGPFLGQSIIDKRIPVRWRLESWSVANRVKLLLNPNPRPSSLKKWWQDSVTALNEARRARNEYAPELDLEEAIIELLGPLLPDRPRGLKSLHNLLHQDRSDVSKPAIDERLNALSSKLSIPQALRWPAHTLFRAVEVAFPSLRLDHALLFMPDELRAGLDVMALWEESNPDRGESANGESTKQREARFKRADRDRKDRMEKRDRLLHMLSVPTGEARPDEAHLRSVLHRLALSLQELRQPALEDRLRFIAISLDADAHRVFLPEIGRQGLSSKVDDLRLRPDRQLVRSTVDKLASWLREPQLVDRLHGLATSNNPIWVGAKAPSSALMWIATKLRDVQVEGILDEVSGRTEIFKLPDLRAGYDRRDAENRLTLREPAPAHGPANVAVLLINMDGGVSDSMLHTFDGAPSDARQIFLSRDRSTPILPADLGPLFQDAVESLNALRSEGVTEYHLGLSGPDAFAFALGRMLHAWGIFHVYEREQPSGPYRPVFTMPEPGEVEQPTPAPLEEWGSTAPRPPED